MEFGIKINNIEQIKNNLHKDKYKFIYFGNEFCERKIPTLDSIKEVFEYCNSEDKTPVFLTPPLTNNGINQLKKLVPKMQELKKEFEITINDYGILNFLKNYPNIKINYGRVLIRMKKGPEIMTGCLDECPKNFKDNSISNKELINYLKSQEIKRFELDIPPQGINLPDRENITLYLGNSLISITRRCVYPKCNTENYNYKIEPCKKECLNQIITKETKFYDRPIFTIGNAEFVKTDMKIPKELNNKFNRIVIFPTIKNNL